MAPSDSGTMAATASDRRSLGVLRALQTEIRENLDLARSTRQLIGQERDMLQGDIQQRLVLNRFHTDMWQIVVAQGGTTDTELLESMVACYQQLHEVNELVAAFNRDGDNIVHSPLLRQNNQPYGRDNVVDIIRETVETAEDKLHTAAAAVEDVTDRTCSDCGERFATAAERKDHEESVHE